MLFSISLATKTNICFIVYLTDNTIVSIEDLIYNRVLHVMNLSKYNPKLKKVHYMECITLFFINYIHIILARNNLSL